MVTTRLQGHDGYRVGHPARRYPDHVGGRREHEAAPRRPSGTASQPSAALVVGFVLAGVAVLAVFLTTNADYLRLAVIGAAAGCVLVAVAAGRRRADQPALAAREAELRRGFEQQLDREEAAHREIELRLENDLRREAEESVRYELDALRREIAALSSMRGDVRGISVLRDQLAALPALRDELASVSAMRAEVAAMNALRDEVEALAELRDEFGRLGELRAEVSRLRTEITEQLSSELLVERIVMRAQGRWSAGDAERGSAGEEPAREWPAGDERGPAGGTREYERAPAQPDETASPPTAEVRAITAERPRPQPFPRYERPLPPNDYARRRPADSDDDTVTDPLQRSTRPPAPAVPAAPVVQEPAPTGPVYVSEILAEQGTPPPSGRRRRRYRDEDTEDDVLSRVLHRD